MRNKLQNLQSKLSQGMVGREETVKTALLAMIAGENLLLIGPPGTGKSMVARQVSQALVNDDADHGDNAYFEYLLTKFSTPEELFGPLSISELKQDRFKRNTQGYLPTVKIAFLDEIFKASSSILNSLLTILNERKFHNGTDHQAVPLQAVIAASNELPNGQSELSALYDRFLLRRFVGYLDNSDLNNLFDLPATAQLSADDRLSSAELAQLQAQAEQVEFPNTIRQVVQEIWANHAETFKEDNDEQLSDRRFVKAVHLMRISAASNGRNQADLSDVLLLKDCLWNNDKNIEQVHKIVLDTLRKFDSEIDEVSTDEAPTVKPKQPSQNSFKGLQGSGTADDPILIHDVQEFVRLADEKIGQQGHHFRQMADIDFTALGYTSPIIEKFIGHYDGNGFKLIHTTYYTTLFYKIQNSYLTAMYLENLALANTLNNCTIDYCDLNQIIHRCHVGTGIYNCTIQYSNFSIKYTKEIKDSFIEFCNLSIDKGFAHVFQDLTIRNSILIVNSSKEGTTIHNSFIENNLFLSNDFSHSRPIFHQLNNTAFKNNVLGYNDQSSISFDTHIFIDNIDHQCQIMNNFHLFNTNLQVRSFFQIINEELDGKRITLKQYNQHYFEHTLGWDFDMVWYWDDQDGNPALQTPSQSTKVKLNTGSKNSLLLKQVKQNIWLN